jgi:hypothetical protein
MTKKLDGNYRMPLRVFNNPLSRGVSPTRKNKGRNQSEIFKKRRRI